MRMDSFTRRGGLGRIRERERKGKKEGRKRREGRFLMWCVMCV